jgi:hypothetical protein
LQFRNVREAAGVFRRRAIDFAGKLLRKFEIAGHTSAVGVDHGQQTGAFERIAYGAIFLIALEIGALACGDRVGGTMECEIEIIGVAVGKRRAVLKVG